MGGDLHTLYNRFDLFGIHLHALDIAHLAGGTDRLHAIERAVRADRFDMVQMPGLCHTLHIQPFAVRIERLHVEQRAIRGDRLHRKKGIGAHQDLDRQHRRAVYGLHIHHMRIAVLQRLHIILLAGLVEGFHIQRDPGGEHGLDVPDTWWCLRHHAQDRERCGGEEEGAQRQHGRMFRSKVARGCLRITLRAARGSFTTMPRCSTLR